MRLLKKINVKHPASGKGNQESQRGQYKIFKKKIRITRKITQHYRKSSSLLRRVKVENKKKIAEEVKIHTLKKVLLFKEQEVIQGDCGISKRWLG